MKNSFETVLRGKLLVLTQHKPNCLKRTVSIHFNVLLQRLPTHLLLLTLSTAVLSIMKGVHKGFDIFNDKFG
jgi:hypothetical protein